MELCNYVALLLLIPRLPVLLLPNDGILCTTMTERRG